MGRTKLIGYIINFSFIKIFYIFKTKVILWNKQLQ